MKILVFNGSPHKNGNTNYLLNYLLSDINAEIKIVDTFNTNIIKCNDCGYCKNNIGCIINDDMQPIYTKIINSDIIIIASPVYFSQLTGSLLNVISRIQMFYCNKKYLDENYNIKTKTGIAILTAGGDGSTEIAIQSVKLLLRYMGAKKIDMIISDKTDTILPQNDILAIEKLNYIRDKIKNYKEY